MAHQLEYLLAFFIDLYIWQQQEEEGKRTWESRLNIRGYLELQQSAWIDIRLLAATPTSYAEYVH
jgi:hypothetical protein